MSRRRSPGEGHVFAYQTKVGVTRFGIKFDRPGEDGRRKQVMRRVDPAGNPWLTEKAALRGLRDAMSKADRGQWVDPSRQPLGAYLAHWLDGLRLAPGTVASYRQNIRLHVEPYIGTVPLSSLTTARLDALYRQLEREGRHGPGEDRGLGPATVRYVHMVLSAALAAAVESGQLGVSPAARAHPPTAKQAAAPEMQVWTAAQLAAFLDWTATKHSQYHVLWHVLAYTGMRRGEALALRWRDVDLAASSVTVRRSAGVVPGQGGRPVIAEGPTKTGKPRVVDLDAATVALLRAYRRERGALALQLGRADALVFADHEGRHRDPRSVSALFGKTLARCRKALGDDAPPVLRLHGLRHTHATHLLSRGEDVKTVSARLGHSSPAVTLGVYAHVLPGRQAEAAARFAAMVEESRS